MKKYKTQDSMGAGTAGCVLANRLSLHHTVLLIEAGDFPSFWSNIPLTSPILQRSEHDWQYETAPQANSSGGLKNNVSFWPRGKVLGGSGQINLLNHYDGRLEDFEAWGPWFDYGNVSKVLGHIIGYDRKTNVGNNVENFPVRVSLADTATPGLTTAIVKSKHYLSKLYHDVRISVPWAAVYRGARFSSLHGYLYPILNRRSLHVLLNTVVTQIVIDDSYKAEGVRLESGEIVRIRREVILAAGAIESPKLLQLSGIGPSALLKKHQIPVLVPNDAVGANLFDHVTMPLYVSTDVATVSLASALSSDNIWNYVRRGEGSFNFSSVAGVGSVDGRLGFLAVGIKPDRSALLTQIANYKDETFASLFPMDDRHGFVILSQCLKPQSRGYVHITSSDPLSPPLIDPKYFSHEEDMQCAVQALKMSMEMLQTKPFHTLRVSPHLPRLSGCDHLEASIMNEDYLSCIIRQAAFTSYHPGGTCALGEGGVFVFVCTGPSEEVHAFSFVRVNAAYLGEVKKWGSNKAIRNLYG
ncbi:hypothetical protein M8J75_008742 [Diaphorina citri]|nr:hypothetical protein M8J75_008742 [Diaphorina citri]